MLRRSYSPTHICSCRKVSQVKLLVEVEKKKKKVPGNTRSAHAHTHTHSTFCEQPPLRSSSFTLYRTTHTHTLLFSLPLLSPALLGLRSLLSYISSPPPCVSRFSLCGKESKGVSVPGASCLREIGIKTNQGLTVSPPHLFRHFSHTVDPFCSFFNLSFPRFGSSPAGLSRFLTSWQRAIAWSNHLWRRGCGQASCFTLDVVHHPPYA